MHEVHIRILQHVIEVCIAFFHTEGVRNFLHLRFIALAHGVHVGKGMTLVNRNELGTETESYDGDVVFLLLGHKGVPSDLVVWGSLSCFFTRNSSIFN